MNEPRRWFQVSLTTLFWLVFVVAAFLAGWGIAGRKVPKEAAETTPADKALVSGALVSVKVWDRPTESTGMNYSQTYEGGHVEVYDRFIILTRPSGERTLVRHGYYEDLWFK
jgi:hypothetical protein